MDAVLILVGKTRTQDEYGMWKEAPAERQIFCQVESVTRAEFFDGGRNGLNPEFQFTVFAGDYNGETVCKYKGNQYSIYRTYRGRNDTIELYAERKGGTNG